MEIVTIQLTNNKAYKLLQELEELHIIRLLKKSTVQEEEKLSDKFAGSLHLTDEQYNEFQQYLIRSRSEWERDI
jgi:hypothetical protein